MSDPHVLVRQKKQILRLWRKFIRQQDLYYNIKGTLSIRRRELRITIKLKQIYGVIKAAELNQISLNHIHSNKI